MALSGYFVSGKHANIQLTISPNLSIFANTVIPSRSCEKFVFAIMPRRFLTGKAGFGMAEET
jgi:hypothetical protein